MHARACRISAGMSFACALTANCVFSPRFAAAGCPSGVLRVMLSGGFMFHERPWGRKDNETVSM